MPDPGYPYGDQPPPSQDPRARWPGPPPDPGLWVRGTAPQLSAAVTPEPGPSPETPRKRSPWRWRLTWLAVAAVALGVIIPVSLRATSGMTGTPAAPAGTAAVPCSQIAGQVRELLPYYRFPGKDDTSRLYALEQGLAGKFGNVSNADSPLGLSGAEVTFSLDADDPHLDQDHPWMTNGWDDLTALAAACGIIT